MASSLEIACLNSIRVTDPTDPNATSNYNFVRTFQHRDWIDGESLVQAGKTPEEGGINERFHKIEADLDALGDNVRRAFIANETLRAQLSICLNEIVTILTAQQKDSTKDTKDNTDTKEHKDTKDTKDNKDNREAKAEKDVKDHKEQKENKDDTEKDPKEHTKDSLGAAEKKDSDHFHVHGVISDGVHLSSLVAKRSDQRVFIAPDERPMLGERALNEPRTE